MVFQVIVGVTETESVGTFYVHLDSRCRGKSLVETLLKSNTSVNVIYSCWTKKDFVTS